MSEPVFKSFKDWSYEGYVVKKGEKATTRVGGVPLFSDSQVKKLGSPSKVRRSTPRYYYQDFDREEDAELADYYGIH